jgi:hypothetical protein
VVFFANEHCQATYVRRAPGESPNDRNDRAIRVAVSWLNAQINPAASGVAGSGVVGAAAAACAVLLLSDDRLNRAAARAMPPGQRPQCASTRELVSNAQEGHAPFPPPYC